MEKPPKKPKREKPEQIETEPDAWERFEDAIERMVPPRQKPKFKPPRPENEPDKE